MSLGTNDPIARAHELISNTEEAPSLQELAQEVGLSAGHLQRRFRARYGMSPAELAASRRLARLKTALRESPSVTDAVYAAGFGSGSRVYEKSDTLLGMTPADYRRGGAGATLRYTTLATPLGELLVAATERGICAILIGASEDELLTELAHEFPAAQRERVDAGRDEWLARVIAEVHANLGWSDATDATDTPLPPFDLRATAFQWRVWQALTRIPRGETRSYSAIAEAIGSPRAVRAVARACATNRLAIMVPCHRVVREDGTLGGYRWGLSRKQRLLAREAEVAPRAI
ncbi:MAG TPA: methylated-DNA--[protein]-cysteine S-methyltransferase [Tahibacter sp.]|uniref:methylated-DNA--[protein]-cysteine S-methyltransferase n=1 Tax=Tahibacter sp. TaxID=2056211 RepID=UPI002C421508|nr:methylated-DNA--[protein]-cysteine S-methyltransferase [Tahibacter sp.]HSX60091.1 methylated-DNA--[protein]-cysteine S-methyltransferase [Tahibacter sp.]